MFDDLDPEILRDRFAIHLDDLKLTGKTKEAVEQVDGIVKVNANEEVSNGFIALRNIAHGGVCGAHCHFAHRIYVHHFQHH